MTPKTDKSTISGEAALRTIYEVTGLCHGTSLLTLDGKIPVEFLSPGDRVITRDQGMAVLRQLRVRDVDVAPIRIKAGSLGSTRPDKDMIVAPETQVLIRDWRAEALFGIPEALVSAKRLVDGEYVAKLPLQQMKIYDLIFDKPRILYADGIEVRSFAPQYEPED